MSLKTESTAFKAALLSQHQNIPDHNSPKVSSENSPRLRKPRLPVITSPGTGLFHAAQERPYTTAINSMNGIVVLM